MPRIVFKPLVSSTSTTAAAGEMYIDPWNSTTINHLVDKDNLGNFRFPIDEYFKEMHGYDNDLLFDKNGHIGMESQRDFNYAGAYRVSSSRAGVGSRQSDFRSAKNSLRAMPSSIQLSGDYQYIVPMAYRNPVAVHPNRTYKFSFFVRYVGTPNGIPGLRAGILPFDAAGRSMTRSTVSIRTNTKTTLAKDLNPGDTKVFVTTLFGWDQADSISNRIAFFDFKDEFGPYNDYTYTPVAPGNEDSFRTDIWHPTNLGVFDMNENSILLKAPWAGAKHLAGAKIAQGTAGAEMDTFLFEGDISPEFMYNEALKGLYGEVALDTPYHGTMMFPKHARYVAPYFVHNVNKIPAAGWSTEIVDLSVEELPYYYVSSPDKLPISDSSVVKNGKRTLFTGRGEMAFVMSTKKLAIYSGSWTYIDGISV